MLSLMKTNDSKIDEMKILTTRHCFFAAFLFSLAIFGACFSRGESAPQTQVSENSNQTTFEIPASEINLAKPLEISKEPKDAALCEQINQTIEQSEFANAHWGVFVVSLKDGRVICGRDARKLFNPASIEKTLTSIVALDKLGADFRWQTKVFSKANVENGTLNGDLTIYGEGAPNFDSENLESLANQLESKGLKHVKGNVIGDDSYFKGEEIGDGWTWNDLQWYYGSEASALTFKENQADIFMKDGKPTASTDYLQVQGELKPKQNGEIDAFGVRRGLADNQIYVWGYGDKGAGRISVHNPALWTAKNFKELLAKKGITVDGDATSVDWKSENKLDAANAVELASVDSKTLGEIVNRMNKHSVNLYGELLLRLLGKKFGDGAPDESRQIEEVRGDDSAGTAVVKKFLGENKVVTDEIQIHDGSGLSRLDFISPEAFGRALVYAAQSKFADVFEQSLPIAATDGTLGGRLGRVKGKILAKTGSITYVNSLAGYAQAAENEIYAFAIISNNITRKSDSSRIIDQIAASLVDVQSSNRNSNKTNSNKNNK
jgi:D-alanyl-D-alanine carboxypeptidase/D-alanyl-D-alanine-endopeptidase (penicillin-binding protein 4)